MKKIKERDAVNVLLRALRKNEPDVYIYVDRDSGTMRHTRSGWDFMLCRDYFAIFVEAKVGDNKLTDWQHFVRNNLLRAGCIYRVLRFSLDGKTFRVENDKRTFETARVQFSDFLAQQ